jgi:ABC-type lipoprotein export system ATPase subunit
MISEAPLMILQAKNIIKHYRIAGVKKKILDGIDLMLEESQVVSITGKSGCGKTTLLNVISGITSPDSGSVHIHDKRMIYALDVLTSRMRNREIGFIFQTFRLLPDETVFSNVLMPARIRGRITRQTRDYADEMMDRLKIYKFKKTKAAILSGGQKQRVAIARALVNRPNLILADEPTANLDKKTAVEIFEIILDLKKEGKAVLVVTHDEYMHERSDGVYYMEDGILKVAS